MGACALCADSLSQGRSRGPLASAVCWPRRRRVWGQPRRRWRTVRRYRCGRHHLHRSDRGFVPPRRGTLTCKTDCTLQGAHERQQRAGACRRAARPHVQSL